MSNSWLFTPKSCDRIAGRYSALFILSLFGTACINEQPSIARLGGIADTSQGDTTCEIPKLPADVTFLTGPDPITQAELTKRPVEEVLHPCLFANGADMAKCASRAWIACEACIDARCALCADEDGNSHTYLSSPFPVCDSSSCTYEQMSNLLSAPDDPCAFRLSWDAIPEKARLWLNPEVFVGDVCANRTRTRFRLRSCGAEVVVREFGANYAGFRATEIYACAFPADSDVWSVAFPFRRCTAASWGLDSEIAAASWGYNPTRPEFFRHEGALCVRVKGSLYLNQPYWRPETPEELAGLKTDGCDPK